MKLTELDKQHILDPLSKSQLSELSKKDLIDLFLGEQNLRLQAYKELENKYEVEGRYIIIKRKFFAPSSEKSPRDRKKSSSKNKKPSRPIDKKKLKPSERYPNVEVVDYQVEQEGPPMCQSCDKQMVDSGLRSVSETLSVIPKKYIIERHHHVTYKCPCCDSMETTARVPRIKPGSSYSDQMIVDVAMSKYCDLIPMERYAKMAAREGFIGLPPNSLIELTHYLSFFCEPIVEKIRQEVLSSSILYADETPHNMMEQDKHKSWYLWGFSTKTAAYFECHPSRSGDVAAAILKNSSCEYLVSDVYSGYSKAIRLTNTDRDNKIEEVFCNAHARRKFKQIDEDTNAAFIIRLYKKIYKLEKVKRKLQDDV